MSFILNTDGKYLGKIPNLRKDILVAFPSFDLDQFLKSNTGPKIELKEALFTPLVPINKQQPGYQYPIELTEKTWQKIASKGGQRPLPFIYNNSTTTVFVKPEDRVQQGPGKVTDHKTPIALLPGGKIYGGIDGINTWRYGSSVFKVVDGVKVIVNPDGDITIFYCQNLFSRIGQWSLGGWKDRRNRSSWIALSNTFSEDNSA